MSKEAGERIKEKRLQFGYSQAKLAELVGVHRATISKFEAGRTDRMSSAIASRLADCFGVSPAWICGLDVNEDFKVELTGEEEFIRKLVSALDDWGDIKTTLSMAQIEEIVDFIKYIDSKNNV